MNDTNSAATMQSVSVGELLSNARKAAGWTVVEVASKLNMTVLVIESLEQNQFAQLPGTTFARGYVRSYAKLLNLDAAELVKFFDQQNGTVTDAGEVHTIDRMGESRKVSRGMLQLSLFLLFLIVLAAVYYGWQSRQANESVTNNKPQMFERVEVERADGSVHVQTLDELEDQAVALALEIHSSNLENEALTALAENEPVEMEQAVSEPLDDTLTQLPAVVTEPQPTVITPVETTPELTQVAEGTGVVQLTFANDCWLRVVDAAGTQLAGGLKRGGEQLTVTGKAPLDVHLGYAKGVSIIYNGKAVDFSAAISGETARLKLGQ